MNPAVPTFPAPQRDLDIDLATEGLLRGSSDISQPLERALARALSLLDSKRTRAAATELARIAVPYEAELGERAASVIGLQGALRLSHGDPIESERLILAALATLKKNETFEPMLQASLIHNLGVIAHRYQNRPTIAEERFSQAITLLEGDKPASAGRLSLYHRNLAIVRDDLGDFDGAAAAYRSALATTNEDPVIGLNIVENLVVNREVSGHVDEAESYLEAAFLNLRTWRTEYPRLFLRVCDDLSFLMIKKGEFIELRGIGAQQAAVCLTALPAEERWRAIQPLTFVALAQWLNDEVFESGATLRQIASLHRQTPQPVPGAAAIVGGVLEMFTEDNRPRREQAIRNFQAFAAKLSF